MKANNNILLALLSVAALILILSGCRSKKETLRTESTQKLEQKNDIQASSSTQATNLVKQSWSDLSASSDSLSIHTVKLNFSKPDSIGKQHLESAEITDITQHKHNQNNVQGTKTDSTAAKAQATTTDKSKFKASGVQKATNTTEVETKTHWLVDLVAFATAIAGVCFVFRLLKRYNILK